MIISERIKALAKQCDEELAPVFAKFDETARFNTEKVLSVFQELGLAERHFAPTNGYGYNDDGRDLCDKAFAKAFGCKYGFVRHNIVSGTHALGIGLFGILRPGDTMLSVAGKPYDTLDGVIGINGANEIGSLAEFGVKYKQIDLIDEKHLDLDAICNELKNDNSIKMIFVQRSKGYLCRSTLSAEEITELYNRVKAVSNAFVVVDNCYGEFCDKNEPTADLLIGSLIKNPGGGIAETGGYLVGTKQAVELVEARLTVPGIGAECGASMGQTRNMLKGLFFAPHIVAQALKTAAFTSLLFKKLGYGVNPEPFEERHDIIQTVSLEAPELLCAFCKGLQHGSPVDSFVVPEAWDMPGYGDPVIMAAGAFTQGSSLELSADGPLRPPYTVFVQGGLTYESGRYGIMLAAEECENAKINCIKENL